MLYILFLCMCRIMRPSKDVAVAVILLISVRIHCTANAITKTVQKMQCHFGGMCCNRETTATQTNFTYHINKT